MRCQDLINESARDEPVCKDVSSNVGMTDVSVKIGAIFFLKDPKCLERFEWTVDED